MPDAGALIDLIRRQNDAVARALVAHPYVRAVEEGRVPGEALRMFAGEQYAIIDSDLRSVAHLVSRFSGAHTRPYFLGVLTGEEAALSAIVDFAAALGMTEHDLREYEPRPGAHAYTCYMAWLGLFGSEAEVATAYLVNFPAWGENCGRLSRALRDRYGMGPAATRFFDQFAAVAPDFEKESLAVIQHGLDRGIPLRAVHRAARLLQAYEVMYWDTLAAALPADGGA